MSAVESAAGREAKNICSVRALPVVSDAVEKVGGMPSVRNNRNAGDDFLNRSCAFGGRLESMLLGDPPQNPFSTASARSGR
jgi:hypothetical protein